MTSATVTKVLRGACVVALAALGLMVWSLLDPRPIPVVVAMSVGQVLGTASLLAFLVVVVGDLRGVSGARRSDGKKPPSAET